jgi:hypothetical protein
VLNKTLKKKFTLSCGAKISFTKPKKLMYQALVQSILLYGAETWTLNTQQAKKLLATDGFLEKICEKIKERKGPKCHH